MRSSDKAAAEGEQREAGTEKNNEREEIAPGRWCWLEVSRSSPWCV